MGQLEKYGLYVLCLVIFLILGVTIWGGGDLQQPDRRPTAGAGAELNANGPGGPGSKPAKPANTGTMGALLDPGRTSKEPKNDPKPVPSPVAGNGEPAKPVGGKSADQPVDPAVTPQPIAETVRPTHKVAAGDTFESIAKQLGSAALRTELQRLNPRVEPTRMRQGVELQLPTKAEVEQFLARGAAPKKAPTTTPETVAKDATASKGTPKAAPAASATTYTVAKGDTFEGIAVRQLGSKKRLDELLELNPNVRPTGLKVGQKIQLPKK